MALWDWEFMHFQAHVYIIFVYRVVYVDMSTRSSQLNHLSLESLSHSLSLSPHSFPPFLLSLFYPLLTCEGFIH